MQSRPPPPSDPEAVVATGVGQEVIPTSTVELDGCVLGHWRGILIGVWAISSTRELVLEQDKLMKTLCARMRKFSSVHLVIKSAPLPSAEVRDAYKVLLRTYSERIACAAILLEGDGFWASSVRAFMTGVAMFERQVRIKTFARVDPLAAWLAPLHSAETSERVGADELRLALNWMLERPTMRKHREQFPQGR